MEMGKCLLSSYSATKANVCLGVDCRMRHLPPTRGLGYLLEIEMYTTCKILNFGEFCG